MRRIVLACILLVVGVVTAEAQLSVVTRARMRHPNLAGNREVTLATNKEIAAEIGAGIYKKPSGNNCGGYSCDIICFKDGTGRDIWGDWENKATPTWSTPMALDGMPERCEFQGTAPPPENPPPPPDSMAELIAEIKKLNELLTIVVAQQGGIRAEIQAQTQAVVAATDQVKQEVAKGIKVRF